MTPLDRLLVRVPAVYAELGHAMLPGRAGGDGPAAAPDPVHRPAPGNLDAAEHRHVLVKGLRWWVDVVDHDGPRVGDSVPKMCAVLLGHLHVLAPEDRETLQENLWDWIGGAMPLVGAVPTPEPPLPLEALDRRVPVHVAAKALGVSVSTVKRRADREAGTVLLRDAAGPACVMSDLPAAWCAHCRPGA